MCQRLFLILHFPFQFIHDDKLSRRNIGAERKRGFEIVRFGSAPSTWARKWHEFCKTTLRFVPRNVVHLFGSRDPGDIDTDLAEWISKEWRTRSRTRTELWKNRTTPRERQRPKASTLRGRDRKWGLCQEARASRFKATIATIFRSLSHLRFARKPSRSRTPSESLLGTPLLVKDSPLGEFSLSGSRGKRRERRRRREKRFCPARAANLCAARRENFRKRDARKIWASRDSPRRRERNRSLSL